MIKKIVIIGGGFAGLRAYYRLNKYSDLLDITIIDKRDKSLERPSLPEVSFAGKSVEATLIDLKSVVAYHGGIFIKDEVVKIDPKSNKLYLKSKKKIDYDFLLITTGAYKAFDAVKGFDQYGYSMCDEVHAVELWKALNSFKGGSIVIGTAKSTFGTRVQAPNLVAPCEGPVGEAMFMTDYFLRKKGLRTKSTIKVFTPGEVFFEDIGDHVRQKVGAVMKERDITLHQNKVVKEITSDKIKFEDHTSFTSNLSIIIPPYKAYPLFIESNLGDEQGFVPTDETMRHLDYESIFAAGDINALAQPKLGHIAVHQADIAASAILKEITGKGTIIPFKPSVFCIMDMGGTDATLIFSDHLYRGKNDLAFHSSMARMMKWGFDSYYFYSQGKMPPDFSVKALEKLLVMFKEDEDKYIPFE